MPDPDIPHGAPRAGATSRPVGREDHAALLDAVGVGVWGLDECGVCVYANAAAVGLVGAASAEELVGEHLGALVDGVWPVGAALDRGAPDRRWPELPLRRRDGSEVVVAGELRAVVSPNAVAVLTLRDTADIRTREASRARAQKMEAVGLLTGGICHDFNNLLTVISGNLRLLHDVVAEGDRELVEDALSAATDGVHLTRRLVAVSRDRPLRPRAVDLRRTMSDFARLLRRTLPPEVELELELGEGLVAAVVDRTELESAVLNLALNAHHAMPDGGALRIAVDVAEVGDDGVLAPGRYARVEVSDEGYGMDEETARRSIEPFFTTRAGAGGSGLGLSAVYAFAQQSGGTLDLESAPGVGTTATLWLPWVDRASPQTAVFDAVGIRRARRAARVLVVEDEERVRRFAARALHGLGHEVIEACDGPAAVAVLEREAVDVVFSDVRMPGGMSGHDLARWVAEHVPSLPVVLTSGDGAEYGRSAATSDGEILRKPYRSADLRRVIDEALAAGRADGGGHAG